MRARLCFLASVIVLSAAGCGDDGPPATTPGTDAGGVTPGTDAGSVPDVDAGGVVMPRSLHASIGPITVAPHTEFTDCVTVDLGNDAAMLATEVRATITGSHHLIVYRVISGTESPTPRRCTPFRSLLIGDPPLAMVQEPVYRTPMPAGVGVRIEAHQLVRLELHYVNPGATEITVMGSVDVDAVPAEGSTLQSADFFFWGTSNIAIDRRSTGQASFFARPPAGDATHPSMRFFMFSSHMHSHGVRATVDRTDSLTGAEGPILHESINWSDPTPDWHDPPVEFDGTDGMRVVCDYDNPTDEIIRFGEDTTDEMCFVVALYYPSEARGFVRWVDGLGLPMPW